MIRREERIRRIDDEETETFVAQLQCADRRRGGVPGPDSGVLELHPDRIRYIRARHSLRSSDRKGHAARPELEDPSH